MIKLWDILFGAVKFCTLLQVAVLIILNTCAYVTITSHLYANVSIGLV